MQHTWEEQIQKFRDTKKKSVIFSELLSLAENLLLKVKSLTSDNDAQVLNLQKEIESLKQENKDLRSELDIAWKNQ